MKKGVVIGKFYPPHAGHCHLITTAMQNCDHLSIIVCHRPNETIGGAHRQEWLQQLFPEARVILKEDKNYPPDDSRLWAKLTTDWLGFTPDIAFTSESYGRWWTKYMGSKHMLVDPNRQTYPISGTAVRKNPYSEWKYLSPPVRAHYAKRIVIVGAESTGTTTLSKQLANHYQTTWVPEYGRMYYEGRQTNSSDKWLTEEFIHIASMQNMMEDALARSANKILIADTNSLATAVWHERYVDAVYQSPIRRSIAGLS